MDDTNLKKLLIALIKYNLKSYASLCRLFIKYWLLIFYNTKFTNLEKIPKEGAGILICNHVSYLDGLIIDVAIDRKVHFIIYKQIYELPIVNFFMKVGNFIPIDNNREDIKFAFDMAQEKLKKGHLVCIFPEGKLSQYGTLGRFKPGIEWLLQKNNVPVYPVVLNGLWGSMYSLKFLKSKNTTWQHVKKCIKKGTRRNIHLNCGNMILRKEANINYLQTKILELKYGKKRTKEMEDK